ncbi:unnamed protein product, partial [Vitis vinifera]
MQDIHSMGAGGGRIFGGDRRLRPHQNQALKCPRCESLNTKFCYYNNYNLSQPRHFCKSCRRYWTKGGVLRNVPVGGGCRKTKRSKAKSSSDAPRERKSNSHSSSESSSLTATTTAAATTATTEAVSAPSSNAASTLMTGSNDPAALGFNISDISPFKYQEQEITAGFLDQTVQVELSALQNRSNHGGFPSLDWQTSGDQGIFDLPGNVDQGYWTQSQCVLFSPLLGFSFFLSNVFPIKLIKYRKNIECFVCLDAS